MSDFLLSLIEMAASAAKQAKERAAEEQAPPEVPRRLVLCPLGAGGPELAEAGADSSLRV